MESIVIPFITSRLGRVVFLADAMTGNRKSFDEVYFKLDSGSDFTTLDCESLEYLGYTREYLERCPYHQRPASTAHEERNLTLQYIPNMSLKFGVREIQNCRIFFAIDTGLRSLFGTDILKYFNWEVNYENGLLTMSQVSGKPLLAEGESELQIYSLDT